MAVKIFISHSSKDYNIVNSFVDNILLLGLELTRNDIFCTSSEGMGIKSGEDWKKKIESSFKESQVILLIITPNYKASEICQNEMGAAWMSDKKVIPLIIEPIGYKSVGVVVEPKQISKLNSEDDIDKIHTSLKEILTNKDSIEINRWNVKKRKFLQELTKELDSNPFPLILSYDEVQHKIAELATLKTNYDNLLDENIKLTDQINELEGLKDTVEVKKR